MHAQPSNSRQQGAAPGSSGASMLGRMDVGAEVARAVRAVHGQDVGWEVPLVQAGLDSLGAHLLFTCLWQSPGLQCRASCACKHI